MHQLFPTYKFDTEDIQNQLVRIVLLEESDSYIFDTFHSHEYNEILIFIKGGGTHNINFKVHAICDSSIHLLAANDLHWVERTKTSNGFAIMYKDQLLHKLQVLNPSIHFFECYKDSHVINLTVEEQKDFQFIFNEISQNRQQPEYLLQLVAALITKIAITHFPQLPAKREFDPLIHKIVQLIEQNYKNQLTLTEYAHLLNLEPRTLQNRINKISGRTIKELQSDRLLKEAKRLICISGLSIGEIAFELGFNDVAYFSNWFKKHTGMMPSEYKV
ncbi:MAG TPA: AraC family transcriptional regulator [Flavobacterium sp.]|nr:AraC family transcriptional regulator [Flavobacterium sp.]